MSVIVCRVTCTDIIMSDVQKQQGVREVLTLDKYLNKQKYICRCKHIHWSVLWRILSVGVVHGYCLGIGSCF